MHAINIFCLDKEQKMHANASTVILPYVLLVESPQKGLLTDLVCRASH